MSIKTKIEEDILRWSRVGVPAVYERFVLRNGRPFERLPHDPSEQMPQGECYGNATQRMQFGDGSYVEGLAWHPKLPMLIPHAWNLVDGKALDRTWPLYEGAEYYGVALDDEDVEAAIAKTGYYGVFDQHGSGYNLDLMYRIDPELREIIRGVAEAA